MILKWKKEDAFYYLKNYLIFQVVAFIWQIL